VNTFFKPMLYASAMAMLSVFGVAQADQTITIGTFGDPTPMQWAAHEHKFSSASGFNLKWRKFGSGSDIISAMASGDLKISELGSTPLAIAASQGVDLEVFMVDYVIGKAESLIARDGSGIKTLTDLVGKRVAVPFGSTSDFALRGALKHAGLEPSQLIIINMSPDQIVAAWKQGFIDAAYIWPPAQTKILKTGHRIVGSDQVAAWGYPTFNAWVVNKKFAATHKQQLVEFIKEFDKANMAYLSDPSSWTDSNPVVKAIAAQVGDTPKQVVESIGGYKFLSLQEQLGAPWLGGGIATAMKSTALLLKKEGMITTVASDYSKFVNTEYAHEAAK
jgi:taurine transport system substrate-binding protein